MAATAVVILVAGRHVHDTQHGFVAADQRDIHGEFAVALDELLGPVQRVHEPELRPAGALFEGDGRRLFRHNRNVRRQGLQFAHDQHVGSAIRRRQRGMIVFGLHAEIRGLVHVEYRLAGGSGDLHNGVQQSAEFSVHGGSFSGRGPLAPRAGGGV